MRYILHEFQQNIAFLFVFIRYGYLCSGITRQTFIKVIKNIQYDKI